MKTKTSTDLVCEAIESHVQNIIDCEGDTILGGIAHDLYFRGDYHKVQTGKCRFAVYYVGELHSELRACQSTLEGAIGNLGENCVLVILKHP